MSDRCILGIDPGASGAIAFFLPSRPELIGAEDVPVVAGEVDAVTLTKRIREMQPAAAVIEQVGAMPKQGVSSTFKFGVSFGIVRGVVLALGIPLHHVTPGVWKRHFRLDSDKEKARALALRFWPASGHFSRKKDHGRPEAALIARFGAEVLKLHFGKEGGQ